MPPPQENSPTESSIIVIHPGSLNLRMGRSSDVNPITITHAIARRRKSNYIHKDEILPNCIEKTKEHLQEMEQFRLQVSHTLQSCLQSSGARRYATPPQQISAFNRRSLPEFFDDNSIRCFKSDEETVIGDNVLHLDPNENYNVHFPIRRGALNLHSGVGGSLTSVITDLQEIWEYVLQAHLQVDLQELSSYKAVLVIPDIYNRQHLKELTTLLLTRIGFGGCFLVQDHVAASFGAGLGGCCVIDVGDQKTSISCVEDGISHTATRVKLDYGGGDVTQTFFWLLKKCAFPYKDCDTHDMQDAVLVKTLKEEFCHVNLDICGSQEKSFAVHNRDIGNKSAKYTIQVGDECIVAPLSLFHTELLCCPKSMATTQKPLALFSDPEDCFDAEYIRETGRRGFGTGGREHLEQSGVDLSSTIGGNVTIGDNQDEDIVVDSLDVEREIKPFEKEFTVPSGQMLGLDQAVLQSIDRCPNDELKRKMYSCILVVGGGMKFAGIGKWLQNRVALHIPYMYRTETLDIVTSPKDMDPAITVWKGAAVMSCLESAPELWVSKTDYEMYGMRILREKALFVW